MGSLPFARSSVSQPDRNSSRKDQTSLSTKDEYSALEIKSEFDRVHKRINDLVVEDGALTDLASTATLADVITRVNLLAATMRKAGLIRS